MLLFGFWSRSESKVCEIGITKAHNRINKVKSWLFNKINALNWSTLEKIDEGRKKIFLKRHKLLGLRMKKVT